MKNSIGESSLQKLYVVWNENESIDGIYAEVHGKNDVVKTMSLMYPGMK